jgi:hypothetical protein
MTDEKPLKSSLELAMERLAKKDADAGVTSVPVTDAQKAAIAAVRSVYEAKIAELEVLHQSKMAATFDPGEQDVLAQQYHRERDRFISERDTKIDKLRRG